MWLALLTVKSGTKKPNSPLMRCRQCYVPHGIREIKFIGEISAKFFGRPCFLFGSLAKLLIPTGPLFYLQYVFKIAKRLLEGSRDSYICPRPSNMFCLFMAIYWRLAEII